MQKKYRQESKQFLVEGIRLCQELLQSPLTVTAMIFTPKAMTHDLGKKLLQASEKRGIVVWEASEQTMELLSETCQPQGVVACANIPEPKLDTIFFQGRRFLVLMDINDPGNAGTLLRTAEAFGWDRILCVGNTVDIYNSKVIRASMGAAFRLNIGNFSYQNVLSYFEDMHLPCIVSMPYQGIHPDRLSIPEKLALFLGNEAHGLPVELESRAYAVVQIPMKNQVESLNVAIAGAILLFLLQ